MGTRGFELIASADMLDALACAGLMLLPDPTDTASAAFIASIEHYSG